MRRREYPRGLSDSLNADVNRLRFQEVAVERSDWMTPGFYINVLGWSGSAAVVIAYALISIHKVDSSSRVYQWLNLTGSVGLAVNTAYFRAYPSTLVNIVWLIIAASALVRLTGSRSQPRYKLG